MPVHKWRLWPLRSWAIPVLYYAGSQRGKLQAVVQFPSFGLASPEQNPASHEHIVKNGLDTLGSPRAGVEFKSSFNF